MAWGLVAAFFVAAILLGISYVRRAPEPPRILRALLDLPAKTRLDPTNASLALSPGGRRLAIAAFGEDGELRLLVRPLDSLSVQPLAGTEGATYPFWSPDSRFIGFFADRKLKKVDGRKVGSGLNSGISISRCPTNSTRSRRATSDSMSFPEPPRSTRNRRAISPYLMPEFTPDPIPMH